MKSFAAGLLVAAAFVMAGCATKPQLPVAMPSLAHKPKVAVAMTAVPKPQVYLPGASCLLCIIAAQAANSDLSKHAEKLTVEDLPMLKDQVAEQLRKRGLDVIVIAAPLNLADFSDTSLTGGNIAKKNFSSLKAKWGVDEIIVIEISELGFERTYAAYFPTGEPRAYLRGSGYMVNLANNTYDWYQPVEVRKGTDGKWDEPAAYPGLTNAYYQTIELGKDSYLKALAR